MPFGLGLVLEPGGLEGGVTCVFSIYKSWEPGGIFACVIPTEPAPAFPQGEVGLDAVAVAAALDDTGAGVKGVPVEFILFALVPAAALVPIALVPAAEVIVFTVVTPSFPAGPLKPMGPIGPVRPIGPAGPLKPIGPVSPMGPIRP